MRRLAHIATSLFLLVAVATAQPIAGHVCSMCGDAAMGNMVCCSARSAPAAANHGAATHHWAAACCCSLEPLQASPMEARELSVSEFPQQTLTSTPAQVVAAAPNPFHLAHVRTADRRRVPGPEPPRFILFSSFLI